MAKQAHTVDSYIAARTPPVRALLVEMRSLILSALPDAEERMKYGAPMYFGPGGDALAYLYGGKDHAHLGFIGGDRFEDPEGLLTGRGDSRHVVLRPGDVPPETALRALLAQCKGP